MNRYETSLPERIKYGLGDFAQNGVFTFMSSYFLFFCTDIAGIGLEYAGMVTFIGRIYYKKRYQTENGCSEKLTVSQRVSRKFPENLARNVSVKPPPRIKAAISKQAAAHWDGGQYFCGIYADSKLE